MYTITLYFYFIFNYIYFIFVSIISIAIIFIYLNCRFLINSSLLILLILGLAPTDAVSVLNPLENARKKLILKTGFHLVFLVTPPNTHIEPDWTKYEIIVDILYRENKVRRRVFLLNFSKLSSLVKDHYLNNEIKLITE